VADEAGAHVVEQRPADELGDILSLLAGVLAAVRFDGPGRADDRVEDHRHRAADVGSVRHIRS
jgi:hypothetical protein